MNTKVLKKVMALFMLLSIILSNISNLVFATQISEAALLDRGDCGQHLQYWSTEKNAWSYVITTFVTYSENGKEYPAYCVNSEYQGVGEREEYTVDVDSLIDDVRIWRVVKNSYPYKTPTEMGVENEYDAFVATKQAIYSVLYDYDAGTRYRGGDARGTAIANAIVNLVDIGRNGTETPYTDGVSASQVGSFTNEGDCYSQEFQINCGISVSEYSIVDTVGLPAGSIITDVAGNQKTTFLGGEHFKIKIPPSQLGQDINITFRIQAKAATYPVFYGRTRIPGTQNYALTYDPLGDVVGVGNLNVQTNNGKIQINKTDDETKQPIEGVVFALYKDGTEIARSTTNGNGIATFNNLFAGDYILKEISTNKNYVLNNKEFSVNVKYNETTPIEITNEYKKGQIKVIKVDKDNNEIRLPNIEFKVYDEKKNLVDTLKTDKNGEATTKKLRINQKYTIQETKTLQNYVLNDTPVTVTLSKDQIETVTFENELKKGQIRVIKVDEDFNEIKLKGVEFKVYDEDNKLVDTLVTDENGEAVSKRLRIDKKYTIEETKTLQNYILTEEPQTVTLTQDQIKDVKFENEHKKGNLKIYKVDKDNHKIALGNVKFDLFSEEFNKVIGTYTTNVDGEIKIDNLRIGNYKLIEKNTGKWYDLAENTEVKIEWKETTESMVENELKKGQVKIIKIDKDNHEVKLEGVKFNVLDEKGNVLETITTDRNGEAFTSRYPIRDYEKLTLVEIETLDTYALNDKPQTIVLEANKIKNITFENEVKKAQIKVIKIDKDNKEVKLEGVKFDIKDEKGNVVDTITTDKNGEATTKRLPITSKYTAVETQTKKEYVLTKETQTVTLKQDEIKNITFKNEKRKGKLKVIKVDKDNKEVKLKGVKFDIKDEKGNVVDTVTTDKNGEAITKDLPCVDKKYTVVEKSTNKEYVLTKETQTVELKENEITSITFENEKIKGYVEVTKVDSKTKEKLQGAVFGIYDSNNKEVGRITTDKTGKAKSELLPYGKYTLKELDTGSDYYLLNEKTFKFEIVKNHKTVPLTVENDSVDIEVTVDKKETTEIKPGEKVNYEFSNVGNASNVYLENFKWFDYIPTDYVRLETMTTGTWNQDLTYDVYYKTNKSEDYILRYKDLKTSEEHLLDFTSEITLAEDEYIVETMFDFGKVDVGFKEATKPTMQCKSFDTLKENDTFTNYTKTVGVYFGITAEANSKWTTVTHVPEEKHEVRLPKTGK